MPPGVLRPFETIDAALVHVVVVREPHENKKLSRAAAQRGIDRRADANSVPILELQNLPPEIADAELFAGPCAVKRTLYHLTP